jgi:hypothetical protein
MLYFACFIGIISMISMLRRLEHDNAELRAQTLQLKEVLLEMRIFELYEFEGVRVMGLAESSFLVSHQGAILHILSTSSR